MIERREDEEAGSDTPQGCLSPDTEPQSDTPTPTPTQGPRPGHNNVDRIREQVMDLNPPLDFKAVMCYIEHFKLTFSHFQTPPERSETTQEDANSPNDLHFLKLQLKEVCPSCYTSKFEDVNIKALKLN